MTHTIKARQRNDKELAAVDNRIEILEAELNDLHAVRRALLASRAELHRDPETARLKQDMEQLMAAAMAGSKA